ncbi:uncharacterized protein PV09_06463 [Verruconis gallopava]|uniref:Uncharacterized protein n=1 Tax=Verruconis gallopava TaxID=253628 RepID=A0A0D1YNN2_9PEZI|nr:uncharacterized protein PV09_06463 [Verruconis gallopava]KIW02317.1 hypothetical protein PV09_06463 [Verruconis gallopava]
MIRDNEFRSAADGNDIFPLGSDAGEISSSPPNLISALDAWGLEGRLNFPVESDTNAEWQYNFSIDFPAFYDGFQAPPGELITSTSQRTPSDLAEGAGGSDFIQGQARANAIRDRESLWSCLPKHCDPTGPFDEMILDLLRTYRDRNHMTETPLEFGHSDFPSVNSLLNPIIDEPDKPVSSTIARHMARVIRVNTLPEKIALLYITCMLIRWQICPSAENYATMPRFMQPGSAQLVIAHPVWIDTIGWPKARQRLIEEMDFTEYPDWASLITRSFSINWPYGL